MARRLPSQLPAMLAAIMGRPMLQMTAPFQMKRIMAPRLEAKFMTLDVAEASMRLMRSTQCRARIRKLPVPGPKKPS